MASLCEKITAWLDHKGTPYRPEYFATVQIGDEPESISHWNDTLGARPTASDLAPFANPGLGAKEIRRQRALRLAASDWTMLPDAPLLPLQKAAWAVYRKLLRDVTLQPTFPRMVLWPDPPA